MREGGGGWEKKQPRSTSRLKLVALIRSGIARTSVQITLRGDGLAQWLERRTRDPKVEGFEPRQEHKKKKKVFSESKRLC